MKKASLLRMACLMLVFSVLLSFTMAYAETGSKDKSAISKAKDCVVRVFAEYEDGSCATGSAFGVGKRGDEPEYFITNSHVVFDANEGALAKNLYILLDDEAVTVFYDEFGFTKDIQIDYDRVVECEVVNADTIAEYPDVAVIKSDEPIEGRGTLPLYETSEDVTDAQVVYALGYPGTTDNLTINSDLESSIVADIEDVTITDGIVSMKTNSALFGDTDVILHSAPINHGNSGGPLLDEDGAVVGINTYLLDSDSAQYVSIYIDYAITILDEEEIPYAKSGSFDALVTYILLGVIAVTVVVAVLLIVNFKGKAQRYVDSSALRVQCTAGTFAGRRFELVDEIRLGRAPDNDIIFPTGTKGVSAHHCVIRRVGSNIYITDLGSSCGTQLNGSRTLTPNLAESIVVGDRFMLGSPDEAFVITRKGGAI